MVFSYGHYDIIIQRSSLEKYKEGLSEKLIAKYKLEEDQYDNELILISAKNNDIAEQIIKALTRRYKLIHIKDGKAKDFICVKDPAEVDGRCDWLRQSQFYEVLQISGKIISIHKIIACIIRWININHFYFI